jgi:hypothetical protein
MEKEVNQFLEEFEKGHLTRRQLIAKLGGIGRLSQWNKSSKFSKSN